MKTKTYSEFKGEKPFDWNEFLSKEQHSAEEHNNAHLLSKSWITCACGNQCSIIPRDNLGMPLDNRLRILGVDFTYNLYHCNFGTCKSILKQIEERSAFLIKEIKMV